MTYLRKLYRQYICKHQWNYEIVYPDIGWSASFVKECKCCGKAIIQEV
jgi:hypothetical protein